MIRVLLVAVLLLVGGMASAQSHIVGRASVVDGDTLEVHGKKIRLVGIDAHGSLASRSKIVL